MTPPIAHSHLPVDLGSTGRNKAVPTPSLERPYGTLRIQHVFTRHDLLGVLCALVLWVQARSFPEEIKGLGDGAKAVGMIAFASGLSGAAWILLELLLTAGVASALFLFGQLWIIVGSLRYCGRPVVYAPRSM